MTTLENIKLELSEMKKLDMFTKSLARVYKYLEANADELVNMHENEGASISDVADIVTWSA